MLRAGSQPTLREVEMPRGGAVLVTLAAEGWLVGSVPVGGGELLIQPRDEGSVSINGQAYRGRYRFVPVGGGRFDVVNDVDVDGYLKSVISRELYWNWEEETYKAQAIVARTYAIYEAKTSGNKGYWDLYPDQRSQVYGGIAAETNKSRMAVDATRGIVVAYGPGGDEHIIKTYFSSCCGGVSQSAADAFGDGYIVPLSDQNRQGWCSASPKYNWGPVVIGKDELTRRFRLWGAKKGRAERSMATVARLDIQSLSRFGRPVRFLVTDVRGNRYSWNGEEVRWAINTDAGEGTTVYSSFFKIIDEPNQIRIVEGHGSGHGVGLCQWCAQRQAMQGVRHEDIVLFAYPKAKLVRAY